MALINIEETDPWLVEHESCERLFREIMGKLTLRDQEPRISQQYAIVSADIRLRMKQYTTEVQQLEVKVEDAWRSRSLTAAEAERRRRQVEMLQSKNVQLQRLYDVRDNASAATTRARLMQPNSSAFADMGTTTWGLTEDDDDDQPIDVHVSVDELKSQQQRILQEQDQGLEELSKVISRQKHIAQTINNEVDHQNEIIDDLADHIDQTDERLISGTRHVRVVERKDRTCVYWIIILILFVGIVIAAIA